MDFEKLFPGCRVGATDVLLSADGFVRLIAIREDADAPWELTDYAKSLTSAENVVESTAKKRGKQPKVSEPVDLDDLDL